MRIDDLKQDLKELENNLLRAKSLYFTSVLPEDKIYYTECIERIKKSIEEIKIEIQNKIYLKEQALAKKNKK